MKLPNSLRAIICLTLSVMAGEGNAYQFSPDNCDFSMRFGSAPSVTAQKVPQHSLLSRCKELRMSRATLP